MRLLDAQVLNGALLLTIDGSPIEMLGAKAAVAKVLGCEVYLATPGMMSGVQTASRKPGESNLQFLARLAIIDTIRGKAPVPEPEHVVVRRPGVLTGKPVFRGTRVPPAPIFSMLAGMSASEIVRNHYPFVSKADIEMALQQACHLLEREAPWIDE